VPNWRRSSGPRSVSSADVCGEELLPGPAQAEAEVVGRLHYTTLVRNRPRTLAIWRVTTTSLFTADGVARLLGGKVQQDPTSDLTEILTTTSTVGILLEGPGSLDIGWQRDDRSTCDGATQADRQPCICPADFAQRRAAAKQGYGCRPRAEVRFRLQDFQMEGEFDFMSEDWSFVELVTMTQTALSNWDAGCPVRARLDLRRSLHTLHTLHSGIVLPYTRPVIMLLSDYSPSALVSDFAG
jgi:hypothetical protein